MLGGIRSTSDFTDPARLDEQCSTPDRLQTRVETHRRYSESKDSFHESVIQQLDVAPGHRVADIGCGPGNYFGRLKRLGANVVGCDLSPGMAAQARDAGFPTVVADAQHLPFPDATFDRAMCAHVMYHVPDQHLALTELRRVTRPGGRVVVVTNGVDHLKPLRDLAAIAAHDLGRSIAERRSPFTLEDVAVVRAVFPKAEVRLHENCLVFPDAEPVLDYLRSWIGDTGPLEPAMRARITETIEREGSFRVPTIAGCFVADA